MSDTINIKGMDKAELLAALYNNSQPLGLGFLQATSDSMTREEAADIIREQGLYFDYLNGRVMKINLEGDELNPWGYDRDNGSGCVASVVEEVKNGASFEPNNEQKFSKGLDDFIKSAKPTKITANTIELGVNDEIAEALEKARSKFGGNNNDGGPHQG